MANERTGDLARDPVAEHLAGHSRGAGPPTTRALNAMAAAARRARGKRDEPSRSEDALGGTELPTTAHERAHRYVLLHRRVRLLRRAAGALSVVIVGLIAVIIGLNLSNGSNSAGRPRGRSLHPSATNGSGPGASTASPAPSLPPAAAPSATTPRAVPGGAPVLSSVDPASGGPGQVVVISGSNLFSANGQILAYFGSQEAPTSCPAQTSCTVTIPALPGAPAMVRLTVTTDAGTSNALSFDYQ